MASQYAFQQATPPPNSRRGISPATSIFSRARTRSPPAPLATVSTRYNPALYNAALNAVGPHCLRRPSASPMRRGEDGSAGRQYNPQAYGQLAGNGGAFVPASQHHEELPPPPYSPPHSARSQQHHLASPPQRQGSWGQNPGSSTPTSPNNPGQHTPTNQQSFSPYPVASTSATTPLQSPNENSSWSSPSNQRRGYSPPSAPYTPSGLQQSTYPEGSGDALVPPGANRNPSAPPPARSAGAGVPPPPPGPPPAASRSASQSAPAAPAANRSESLTRGAIPPPPPGPPPRSESLTRIQQLMQRQRSVGPSNSRLGLSGSRQNSPAPEVPPLPPVIPPKRKMEQQEDSGRQRASPRHEEERERQKKEDNNPWRGAMDSPSRKASVGSRDQQMFGSPRGITPARVAPPQLSPRTLELIRERDSVNMDMLIESPAEPSPTFTVYRNSVPETRPQSGLRPDPGFQPGPALQSGPGSGSGSGSGSVRRKPVSPSLVTQDLARAPQLPTPPPQQSSPISPDEIAARDVYMNLDDNGGGPSGAGPSKKPTGKEPVEPEDFFHQTRRRYKEMLQAEDAASEDGEKLRLFLLFIEKEARLRQPMYTRASLEDQKRLSKVLVSLRPEEHKNLTPISPIMQHDGDGDVDMSGTTRPETHWWGQNLTESSFPSSAMMAYEQRVADEESSRGRTSSRWWETSGDGGSCSISENAAIRSDDNDSVYGSSYPRRSRKFNKTPRQSLKEIAELANTPRNSAPHDPASYMNSTAYPPDRKGYSRSRSRAPSSSRPRGHSTRKRTAVKTSLDIAPLLTLLPSWPKEYPAINNCHPRLDVFRDLVRTLNDLSQLTILKTRFAEKTDLGKDAFATESQRRRISQAERIQGLYSRGDLHYDEMERLNLDFEREEAKIQHEAAEEEFKAFDAEVVTPAHRDLHERISAASAAYADLCTLIRARNPLASDSDQQPELLEYLTALKWIFDVRETLHKHIFDLLAERNERYKSLILAPLRNARDQSRFQSTSAFFQQDATTRAAEFHKARIVRHEQFMDVVERQVTLGVEEARSKFWEIAPLVMECLEKIPDSLDNVVPIVPPEESVEHPEWVTQPMRYLERKIAEAEGAMKALGLEEGEGLLCLLHGVKTALARAKADGGGGDGASEERRLTEDLKEKVGMIEEEWREGLGRLLERVKEDVEREMERLEPARAV